MRRFLDATYSRMSGKRRVAACLAWASLVLGVAAPAWCQTGRLASDPFAEPVSESILGERETKPLEESDSGIQQTSAEIETTAASDEGVANILPPLAPSSVFTEAQEAEFKRLFGEYLKAENEKKAKAEKEAKAKADAEPYEIGSDPKLNANWNNGLWFTTARKDWNFHFGGRLQWESVFWDEPSRLTENAPGAGGVPNASAGNSTRGVGSLQDGSFFRRVRLRADGTGYELVEFAMEVNFEQVNLITFDHCWMGFKEVPILGTVRFGQHKVPQGMEMIGSDYHLTFLERSSMSDAFWTLFGQGVWISRDFFDQNVVFQTMFHRIQPNGIFTGDFGTGDYADTSRLTWTPLYADEGRHVVHVGGSYQWRRADLGSSIQPGTTGNAYADGERVVRFRARPELRDATGVAFPGGFSAFGNASRFIDSGFLGADSVQTLSPEFLLINGPFSVQAEMAFVETNNARAVIPPVAGSNAPPVGTSYGDLFFWGGYAQASYFLTGENRGYDRRMGMYDRPKVRENFYITRDGQKKVISGSGAWEVGYRYSYIDLNDNNLQGGTMGQHNIGLNWYFNDSMKIQFNYLNIARGVQAPAFDGTVHGFGVLTQIYF
jgi:phosphate-selective porin OprO/OprP